VITRKPEVRISEARARIMLERYAQLKIVRHPMLPLQRRVLELRNNLTAYDGMYVTLAELLGVPLLTDDAKFAGSTGHRAEIHRYPPPQV
jgi:predicted nucleic acid-binding protein